MTGLHASYRNLKRMILALRGQDLWQWGQTRCEKVWLGNEGARWCVCPDDLSESSVVYSFGVGEDISFDLEMIRRFRVQVHAFDPTPRSIVCVRKQTLPEKFIFHAYGIAHFDGSCRFLPPENPADVSHTILQRESSGPAIEVPVRRLSTIMRILGHRQIDLLKMDIEGSEYDVLSDLLQNRIAVKQLLVEFHHRWPEVGVQRTKQAIRALNGAGYTIFSISPNGEEYSFKKPAASDLARR